MSKEQRFDAPTANDKGHVFISYHSDALPTVMKIRDRLVSEGFKTWLGDGSTERSKSNLWTKNVDNARVVLICLSAKYKESPICKEEAEYIQQNKPFIPLRIAAKYIPDGWLGVLVGEKIIYDASKSTNNIDFLKILMIKLQPYKAVFKDVSTIENKSHVLLSYENASQPTVLKIKDRLEKEGIRTMLREKNKDGSTLVEDTSVVLICLSAKYKESASCKSEAEHSNKILKPIIPLKLQAGFIPDGWLKILIGSKLVHDFSNVDKLDKSLTNLINDLKRCGVNGANKNI